MAPDAGGASPRQVGAFAIAREEEPKVFLADNGDVLARVLALQLVAHLPAGAVRSRGRLEEMRSALLDERWADALIAWIEETGTAVDVYDEPLTIWSEKALDADQASMEIRIAPLFSEA